MAQATTNIESSVSNLGFEKKDRKVASRYVFLGYLMILLFFGSIGAWTAYAPVSSAAIAPGLLGKDGKRKTVQHLEGGIIDKILVQDGDKVEANQELIVLKNILSGADYNLLIKQKLIALTKEAGLLAEFENRKELTLEFPGDIDLDAMDKSVKDAIQGQIDAFHVRRDLHREQVNLIEQHIQQAEIVIRTLQNQMKALDKKGAIIAQEQAVYQDLKSKGLATREQVFRLKRDEAANETDRMTNQYSTESKRQSINSLKLEKLQLISTNKKRIVSDLDAVRDQLVDLDEKLAKTRDRLERTVIHAPIGGVIVDLKVNTIGGIVRPGEPLLDIVPDEGKLIIEAQIDPKDRDTVKIGQEAQVRFSAFNQRITQPVRGKVVLISADRLVDSDLDGKKISYYKAKVELLEDPSEVMNGAPVYPGMQAEVMIITGNRTVLEYLLKPVRKSFNHAFRDD